MPISQSQLEVIIKAALASLPAQDQADVAESKPDDVKAAIDGIFAKTGKTNMLAAAELVISGEVSNWTAARAIAAGAQSSALVETLKDFKIAVDAGADETLALAYIAACSACNQFGIS